LHEEARRNLQKFSARAHRHVSHAKAEHNKDKKIPKHQSFFFADPLEVVLFQGKLQEIRKTRKAENKFLWTNLCKLRRHGGRRLP
jgi:hypothetical protein